MWFSNRSGIPVFFFSIIKLSILLLAVSMVALPAFAAPAQKIGVPDWTVPTTLRTDDGYADLQWEKPDGAFTELYRITESRPGSQRQYYVDGAGMRVYRVEPGWYDFRIAACQKNAQGLPLCGQDSGKLRLTVTEAIYDTFPHNQSQSPVQTLSAQVAGGPDQLRPGLWYDPNKSGQGWSFYWANRLALPESNPLFENAYDLVGVYYTFESKNDPSQPGEPAPLDSYRPVVVTFKGVLTGANTYSGNMSIVRQGATDSTGSAVVTFGANNTSATIDWDMHFKLEYLSDVDSLSLLLGADPGSINNATHYSGLWEHATDDSYFVVNDIANIAEAATLVFYDNAGDPVWLQAVNGGSAVSGNTYLCFSYLTDGYRANRSTPITWSQVWYDSGCNSGQTASGTNRNGRRYFSDFGTERFWASFTIAGIDYSTGSVTVGSYSSPAYLGKNANFHGISYDYTGGSSCVMTDTTPSCTVSLTWFTDSDYPNATAYAYNQTTRTKILTSSEPAMENQTHVITSAGVYVFELRMGNSASAELIAQSNTFTVTSAITSGPPAAPTALLGSWDDQANSQYTLGWLHSDTQDVARYEVEETLPGGTTAPLYTVTPGTNLSLSFDKSAAPQGHYQYRVRACNAVGCSTYSGTLNWYTDEPVSTLVFTDDFETIKGWTTNLAGTDTATTGKWERANPEQTSSGATIYQLGTTVSGLYDLVTEGTAGSGVGTNDIDNGVTTITSPGFVVPAGGETTLSFHYYLAHSTSSSEDFFRVYADTSGSDVLLLQELGSTTTQSAVWTEVALDLSAFAGQTIKIRFEAADYYPGDFVEAGVDDVTVNVSSSGGNTPPTVSNPGTQTNTNGAVISLQITATDPDVSDTLTYSATGLPSGLSINTTSGLITGTLNDTVGNHAVTVTVDDGNGGSDVEGFSWDIQNTSPTINQSVSTLTFNLNILNSANIAISDADPFDSLTCQISSGQLPTGLSVSDDGNNTNCVISGTASGNVGSYPIVVTVDDATSTASTPSINLQVIENIANPEQLPDSIMPSIAPSTSSSRIGTTAGQFRVDESGNATYNIPVMTAPGSGGVAPQISLNYSSQSGNGSLGVGWSLGGLSAITRCAQTIEQDTDAQGNPPAVRHITLTATDRFCLDGQRLILVSGTYGASDAEYRTEIDSIARIKSFGSMGTGPTYFTVERKDGSVSEYGNTVDSGINSVPPNQSSTVLVWAQNRFEDSAGNYINYEYVENTASPIEFTIARIEYTGNTNAGKQPYAELLFTYDPNRGDETHSFISGVEISQSKLLTSIQSRSVVNEGGALTDVRYYDLQYDTDGLGRKILDSVEECNNSSKSVCFIPTSFSWIKSLHDIQTTGLGSPVLPTGTTIYGLQMADVNGDGRPDVLYTVESGGNFVLKVKTPTSQGNFTDWGSINVYQLPTKNSVPSQVFGIDLNADGFQDVIYRRYDSNSDTYRWMRRMSDGSVLGLEGALSQFTWDFTLDERDPATASRLAVVDFNGDGLSDLLNNKSERLPSDGYPSDNDLIFEVALNTGNSTGQLAAPVEYKASIPTNLIPIGVSGKEVWNEEVYAAKTPEGERLKNKVSDFNGDGKVDVLRLIWRQFRTCQTNCEQPLSSPELPDDPLVVEAGSEPTYTYTMASYWMVFTSNDTQVLNYQVVARGMGCTSLQTCLNHISLPETDYMLPVDINADGLADLAYAVGYLNNTNHWYYMLNTGNGFSDPIQLTSVRLPDYTNELVRFEDMNGDGYPDLVYPSDTNNQSADWMVLYNDFGNQFAAAVNTGLPVGEVGEDLSGASAQNDASIFADFTGNGKLDLLFFNFNNSREISATSTDSGLYKGLNFVTTDSGYEPSNVIESITDGLGAVTALTYLPLTDTSVYSRMHDAINADWGGSVVYDLIAPIYVVSKATSSAPVYGNPIATSNVQYHYVGAKIQGGGRGFLGFGEVISYDPQSGIRTNTRYRQDFPYIGMPVDTMQAVNASGSKFNRLSNTSASTPPAWGSVSSTTPAPASPGGTRLSYAINEWSIKTTTGGAKFPYISESLERSYTLSGSFDRKVLTSSSYDSYGNVTATAIKTYATDGTSVLATQSTSNTYAENDGLNYDDADWQSAWLLGRLATSSVTHARTGNQDITRSSAFEYNPSTGILNKETIEPGDAYLEVVTTYTLDNFGNRRSSSVTGKNMSTRTSSVTYDSLGRFVIENKNALGQTTLKTNTWDVFGNALEQQNIDNVYTTNTFDLMGRPFASMTGSPSVQNSWTGAYSKTVNSTDTTNCPSGTVFKATTTGGGQPTQFQCFDVLGRATRTAVEKLDGAYAYTDQYYDSSGRVERVSEPYFSGDTQYWNTTSYDKLGRITSVDSAGGDDQVIDYDSDPNIVCTAANVRVVQTTNGLGQVRVEVRNALGETEEVYDELCGKLTYTYDAVGNLTKVTGVDNEFVTMTYDKAGRKISMNDPDKGNWQYAYDALGEMTRQLDSKNQAVDFTYDALGRVTNRRELSGVSSLTDSVYTTENKETSTYRSISPGKGQPSSITYRSGETGAELHKQSFTYDVFGRVQFVSTSIGASTYAEETTYDQYGRVFQQFDASGDFHGLRYVYTNGYVSAIKEAREGVWGIIYQDIQTMDARGNVTAMQLGNGVDVIATYEAASGRLDRLDAWDGAIKIQDVDYLFDVLGNLKVRHDQSAGANLKETFGYDTLNRLETVDLSVNGAQAVTTLSLSYYASGNIQTKSDVGTYLYNGAQPHAVSSAGGNSYGYDDNGNQTSGDGREIDYTVFDKPYSIRKGADEVVFKYGVGNSRYQREDYVDVNGTPVLQKTTKYLGSVERITEGTSEYYKRYLGGVAIATYYPSNGEQSVAYLLKDHIGSIHTVLDKDRLIVARMHFSAFGERQDITDWQTPLTSFLYAPLNHITTRGFTGHEQVDSMGIIHMNGRIYDPKLGRFLQADPIVQAPKNSQNLNRYSYVLNNPLSYTDPTGHSFFKKYWRVVVAAVAIYFTAGAATGWVAGWGAAWGTAATATTAASLTAAGGAVVGAIAGAVGGAILTGTVKGAFYGALSGAALGAIGASGLGKFGKPLLSGAANGITTELQGGKFGHGFLSAGAGTLTGVKLGGSPSFGKFLGTAIAGGTISELTGGKFANGAVTAALSYALRAANQPRRGGEVTVDYAQEPDSYTLTQMESLIGDPDVNQASLATQMDKLYFMRLGQELDVYWGVSALYDSGLDTLAARAVGIPMLAGTVVPYLPGIGSAAISNSRVVCLTLSLCNFTAVSGTIGWKPSLRVVQQITRSQSFQRSYQAYLRSRHYIKHLPKSN